MFKNNGGPAVTGIPEAHVIVRLPVDQYADVKKLIQREIRSEKARAAAFRGMQDEINSAMADGFRRLWMNVLETLKTARIDGGDDD
jgi:hypothetical protein